MMVIGVNGYFGSGKTTLSNQLLSTSKTIVIHLDYAFDDLKEKYLRKSISSYEKNNGEKALYINDKSGFKKIVNLKGLHYIYEKFKRQYLVNYIKNVIDEAYQNGCEYIILEGGALSYYNLEEFCDFKIFIVSERITRLKRVLERDRTGMTDYDIVKDFEKNQETPFNISKYFLITNNGSLEDFKDSIEIIQNSIINGENSRVKK